jgi:enoyl-CoA hydratase/carnithine racemase
VTTDGRHLLVDEPLPHVRRLTLNRPEKRNALDNALRGALFDALRAADVDEAGADRLYPTAGRRAISSTRPTTRRSAMQFHPWPAGA